MRRIIKTLMAVSLGIMLLFVNCMQTSAKNYYDTKYNNRNTKKPYIKLNRGIAEIGVSDYLNRKGYRSRCRKDFNGDGKKEKVVLSMKVLNYHKDKPHLKMKVVLKINNRVVIARKDLGYHYQVSFSTMKIHGKCLAVLLYGDEDFERAGAQIFLWKNNHLNLLMKYKAKGYLNIYTGRDKKLNKDILYIDDAEQLETSKIWPSNVMKRYKKYANDISTSVTKSTYYKFAYKQGKLKKVGKDNYFRVSEGYD